MSGKQYDDRDRGVLFKNDRKEKETDRDYSGSINVDGHDYWLSAWIKEGRNGSKFMSLSVKRKDGQPERRPQQQQRQAAPQREPTGDQVAAGRRVDMDDEIPFAPEFR